MEQILLDTNFISVLFDPRRNNYHAVQTQAKAFSHHDLVYLSAIVLAELRYGMQAAQCVGQDVSHIQHTLGQAANYPLAEVGRHTAEAYGDVKARLADYYLDLSRRRDGWRIGRIESLARCFKSTKTTCGLSPKQSSETIFSSPATSGSQTGFYQRFQNSDCRSYLNSRRQQLT